MHSKCIILKKTNPTLYIIVPCFKPMSRFNENKLDSDRIYRYVDRTSGPCRRKYLYTFYSERFNEDKRIVWIFFVRNNIIYVAGNTIYYNTPIGFFLKKLFKYFHDLVPILFLRQLLTVLTVKYTFE